MNAIVVECKQKWQKGRQHKQLRFVPRPSRKTRTSSVKWRRRVARQPSIGKA